MATNIEVVPRSHTPDEQAEADHQQERARRRRRAKVLGIYAFGAAVWGFNIHAFTDGEWTIEEAKNGIGATIDEMNGEESIEVDNARVDKYRSYLDQIVFDRGVMTLDRSPAQPMHILFDAETNPQMYAFNVDDNPITRYETDDTQPNIVKSLDYVHPALIEAGGVDEIQLGALERGLNGIYDEMRNRITIDTEYANTANPADVGDTINHELAHAIHDQAGDGANIDTIPALTNENPPHFTYVEEVPEEWHTNGSYDQEVVGAGVTARPYGAKNEKEDFATHVEAIFDQGVEPEYTYTDQFIDYVEIGNELTLDKIAVIADVLDQAKPGLGVRTIDQVENKLNERR